MLFPGIELCTCFSFLINHPPPHSPALSIPCLLPFVFLILILSHPCVKCITLHCVPKRPVLICIITLIVWYHCVRHVVSYFTFSPGSYLNSLTEFQPSLFLDCRHSISIIDVHYITVEWIHKWMKPAELRSQVHFKKLFGRKNSHRQELAWWTRPEYHLCYHYPDTAFKNKLFEIST